MSKRQNLGHGTFDLAEAELKRTVKWLVDWRKLSLTRLPNVMDEIAAILYRSPRQRAQARKMERSASPNPPSKKITAVEISDLPPERHWPGRRQIATAMDTQTTRQTDEAVAAAGHVPGHEYWSFAINTRCLKKIFDKFCERVLRARRDAFVFLSRRNVFLLFLWWWAWS